MMYIICMLGMILHMIHTIHMMYSKDLQRITNYSGCLGWKFLVLISRLLDLAWAQCETIFVEVGPGPKISGQTLN